MTHDMKHNDMKQNNEKRDTMFTTRGHHAGYGQLLRTLLRRSGGFAIRKQRVSGFAIRQISA